LAEEPGFALRRAWRLACFLLLALGLLPTGAKAQTIVSLTFDDGIQTQMLVRQSLLSHNMRATFHINSGTVGTGSYYMTWADIGALNADGNEIAGHTVDHRRLTDLTAAQQRSEICDDATALRARGYTINSFAYPYGAGSSNTNVRQALVDCGYISARNFGDLRSEGCTDSSCPFSETIPPQDAYGIRTPEWQADEYSLSELQSFVIQAETHGGGWVPIVLHDMCNQCADSSVSVATFNSFLDWLQPRAGNGTIVKRTRDVMSPAAPSADVSVTKTDSPDPVTVGNNLTYTLKVHNGGPDAASAVTLADPLPGGLSLVSASSTKGTCSGTTTVSCNIGTVTSGTANDVTVTIVATVGASTASSITNTATVTTSTPDPTSSNNQASAQTTVTPSADLQLTKTDSPDPVQAGSNVTYTLKVHNAGPSTATGVSVSDAIPSGLTFVSSSSTQGTCAGTTTVTCDIGTVDAGAANDVTVTIVATAGPAATPSVTNTATVSSSTTDPNDQNNDATAQTTVDPPPSADLQLSKTDSPDPVQAGDDLTYTITVHNEGPDTASAVTVTDVLPSEVALMSATASQGSCAGTSTVTCGLGTLAAGAANDATVTLVVTPSDNAVPGLTNTASASSSTADPAAENNEGSADTTVTAPAPHPSTYVRPKGATPFRTSLVPAYLPCENLNSVHGPPLAFGSCSPPETVSGRLTLGTPDANGVHANSSGYVLMRVLAGSLTTPEDDADVKLIVSLTDVRNAGDLSDYTGELNARAGIRLTDKLNGPDGTEAGTVNDFDLNIAVPCVATASTTTGGDCTVSTSADAITPGMVVERARAIWELAKIVVDDGGPDGVASTQDNTPYMSQGVFVP
jgi:uncharacterized repeat protein (TIGR01451 family)